MKIFSHIILLALFTSCGKYIFKDDKLSLNRQNNTSNELKINGYYLNNNNFSDSYCLYENGIIQYIGVDVKNFIDFESYIQSQSFIDEQKKHKYNWGCYNIDNKNIKFEKWYPSSGIAKKAYVREGVILNDTTFQITQSYRMKRGKKKEISVENETYYFKQFSPKPDSTNEFIK